MTTLLDAPTVTLSAATGDGGLLGEMPRSELVLLIAGGVLTLFLIGLFIAIIRQANRDERRRGQPTQRSRQRHAKRRQK